jgi:hypothetical protein
MHTAHPEKALGPVAVGAIVLAVVLNALGSFAGTEEDHATRYFLVVCVIVAVEAAVVFGFVVPRGLQRGAAGAVALTLSVLGLLSVAVFWTGLPPVLAAGGALLGWAGRRSERGAGLCRAAIVIGALALVADVAVYLLDGLSG